MIAGLADRVSVMYAGRIVEQGTVEEVLGAPRHPYTRGLLDSVPSNSVRGARLRQIPGMTPSLLDLPPGCTFRERCSYARSRTAQRRRRCASSRRHRTVGPMPPSTPQARDGAARPVDVRRAADRAARRLEALREGDSTSRRSIGNRLGANVREEVVHAVDNVDLEVAPGEVVGLVGESGCGKSTLGRLAAGLLAPSAGERFWNGAPLSGLSPSKARRQQLRTQMIFQDPYASLNPRLRVVDIVGEAPVAHRIVTKQQQVEYVGLMLNQVGLDPTLMRRYPHQFSGGQRARIGIARALAVKPEFLVCDESVAALDVSIQAQVLNLFVDLKSALNLTYLFISHDLGVIQYLADRVVVMYLGRVVESAPAAKLFNQPNHPYTQALLAEVGKVEPKKRTFVPIMPARFPRRSIRRRAATSIRAART